MQDWTTRGRSDLGVAWRELQQNIVFPDGVVCFASTDTILDNDCPDALEAIWK